MKITGGQSFIFMTSRTKETRHRDTTGTPPHPTPSNPRVLCAVCFLLVYQYQCMQISSSIASQTPRTLPILSVNKNKAASRLPPMSEL